MGEADYTVVCSNNTTVLQTQVRRKGGLGWVSGSGVRGAIGDSRNIYAYKIEIYARI